MGAPQVRPEDFRIGECGELRWSDSPLDFILPWSDGRRFAAIMRAEVYHGMAEVWVKDSAGMLQKLSWPARRNAPIAVMRLEVMNTHPDSAPPARNWTACTECYAPIQARDNGCPNCGTLKVAP